MAPEELVEGVLYDWPKKAVRSFWWTTHFRDGRNQKEIEDLGTDCLVFNADVADYQKAKNITAAVKEILIDILVNNAGKSVPIGILEIKEGVGRTIDINLKSCFNWIQAVALS